MKKIERIGKRHGKLIVESEIGTIIKSGRSRIYYKCICDCGSAIEIVSDSLNKTKSCGCIQKEMIRSLNLSHGEAKKTKEYKTWAGIKYRCYNKNAERYSKYGGKGIVVCDRWLNNYENFLTDMGRAPTIKHSIDRIDVNGNYEPSNCRWSTNKVQSNNKTTNVILNLNNVTLTMKEWSEKLGYKYKWFHAQLKYKNKTLEELSYGKL